MLDSKNRGKIIPSTSQKSHKFLTWDYKHTWSIWRKICSPSSISWWPSLLAVSHVDPSAWFALTETALCLGPIAETPSDIARWNWISPVPA